MIAQPQAPPQAGKSLDPRALASVLLPGLGQILRGARWRGASIMLAFATALMFTVWFAHPLFFAFPLIIWAWSIWDAIALIPPQPDTPDSATPTLPLSPAPLLPSAPTWIPMVAWLVMALGIGVAVTEFDLLALVNNADRAAVILRPMLQPDFFEPGTLTPSFNGKFIFQGIAETLAMALLATTVGAIFALPISFLAARNLMSGNAFTRGVYYVVRTILNLTRSIESLILAIIFVKVVGLGAFAGFLALTIHTTAALAKLYSEVIEAIDPGPIEAVRGTGATAIQVVRYAVVPQVVPTFAGLTIYRWDINVRTSTIIGLVGGGGIGFYLNQWIRNGDYRAVSASFIAIAVVVVAMDYVSTRVRARLI